MNRYIKPFSLIFLLFCIKAKGQNSQQNLEYADMKFSNFDYTNAIEGYQKALNTNPNLVAAQLGLAEAFRMTNQWEKSIIWYDKVSTNQDFNDQQLLHYAQVLRRLGHHEKAQVLLKSYIRQNENDQRGHRLLASCNQDALNQLRTKNDFKVLEFPYNTIQDDFRPRFAPQGLLFQSTNYSDSKAERIHELATVPSLEISSVEISTQDDSFKYLSLAPFEAKNKLKYTISDLIYSGNSMVFTKSYYSSRKKAFYHQIYHKGTKDSWRKAKPLLFNNTEYAFMHPYWSGDTLYFSSNMEGSIGGMDIFYVIQKDGIWSAPIHLGKGINTEGNEVFPYFHSATNRLYFASDGHVGLGGLDIYYTTPDNFQTDKIPTNLGAPINSTFDDHGLIFHQNDIGFFASNRPSSMGGTDIFGFQQIKNNDDNIINQPLSAKLKWHTPNEIKYVNKNVQTHEAHFNFLIDVESNTNLICTDFKIYIDNKIQPKSGDCEVYFASQQGNEFYYQYEGQLYLPAYKDYSVRIELWKDGKLLGKTTSMVISYNRKIRATVEWHQPNVKLYQVKPKIWNTPKLPIQVNIQSSLPLTPDDIRVLTFQNGVRINKGKFTVSNTVNGIYYYLYENTLVFEGSDVFDFQVNIFKDGVKLSTSSILKVQYQPEKPSLYFLSVGTLGEGLSYADDDALDMLNVFKQQSPKFYKSFHEFLAIGKDATATKIAVRFNDIRSKHAKGEISPNDLVIIFMSSHGYVSESNQFWIQANDFSNVSLVTSAIQYNFILDTLKSLPCQKLLILDACHSGTKTDIAIKSSNLVPKILQQVIEPKDKWVIMTSSKEEYSYEHKSLKNGTFTEALLEGLTGKADANQNGMISIQELYNYAAKKIDEINTSLKLPLQNPQLKSYSKGAILREIYQY